MSARGKLLGMGRGMGRGKAKQPGIMANGVLGTYSAPSSTGETWGDDPAPMNGSATSSSSTWNPAPASAGDWEPSPTYAGDSYSSSTSGFGRSRNGDGGSRTKGCFNCGEEGHMSRDCPSARKSSSACFKCGEDGHISRDCPNGNTSGRGGGSKACFKCGKEGHMSRDCPNADSSGRGGTGGGSRACYKCGEEGHMSRDCPQGGGGRERGGDREKKGCFRCGEDGHMARDCPRPPAEGEKPRENYIPPDSSEEDLFQSTISAGINFAKYDEIPVEVTGRNPVGFISSFEEAGFYPICMNNVRRSHYDVPTPVQKYAIPIIMAGRDLMACAQTGSGKTAAFLLPVITGIVKTGLQSSALSTVQYPQAVVVAPTRELAIQIHKDSHKFSIGIDMKSVVVYGGTSVQHQASRVRSGCNIVVGTPGRLLDFINRDFINLSKVQYLILDEADRMLDMGFEPDIRKLVGNFGMPSKENRQTLMFSATFPEDIQRLAADFLNDYLFVTVGRVGGANTDVTQMFHEVEPQSKREKLCNILSDMGQDRVLVFVEQKRNADFLASFLSTSGFPTTSIHGDRLQREREEALEDFKNGSKPVLIATSVAARGLDIPDVKHVINYDLPSSIDEYVHRIGRTGRCGNLGKATSFFSSNTDIPLASSLVKILAEARQEVPDWLQEYASNRGGGDGYNSHRFASTDIRRRGRGGDGYSNHASSAFGGGDDDGESWD